MFDLRGNKQINQLKIMKLVYMKVLMEWQRKLINAPCNKLFLFTFYIVTKKHLEDTGKKNKH